MENKLTEYRKEIDEIDAELIKLFEGRMAVSEKIGQYKKDNGLPVLDKKREEEKLEAIVSSVGEEMKPYIKELFSTIFSLSRDKQK